MREIVFYYTLLKGFILTPLFRSYIMVEINSVFMLKTEIHSSGGIVVKIKEGWMLREVAGEFIAIPVGAQIDFDGMITLNETGKVIWTCLEKGAEQEELVQALLNEFDVDEQTAKMHVAAFTDKLKELELLA